LMRAVARYGLPARREACTALAQPGALCLGAGEAPRLREDRRELRLAPEEHAHVEPAPPGALEHVEERAVLVGQPQVWLAEGARRPDTRPGRLDGGADATKRRLAVDEGSHPIADAQRVRPCPRKR